jgi:hypothetical protein
MFENEVNKLFAFSFCNSRASREGFSYRHIASGLCPNCASSNPWAIPGQSLGNPWAIPGQSLGNPRAANFYAAIAEFFPGATDFCSLNISAFITSSDVNYVLMPT